MIYKPYIDAIDELTREAQEAASEAIEIAHKTREWIERMEAVEDK